MPHPCADLDRQSPMLAAPSVGSLQQPLRPVHHLLPQTFCKIHFFNRTPWKVEFQLYCRGLAKNLAESASQAAVPEPTARPSPAAAMRGTVQLLLSSCPTRRRSIADVVIAHRKASAQSHSIPFDILFIDVFHDLQINKEMRFSYKIGW